MYLTRIEINPRRRETVRALESPEIMHAIIMAGFPSFVGSDERVLYRIDRIGKATYVLIQSGIKPDLTHMVEQLAWPGSDQTWETLDYDGFLGAIEEGDVRRFRLTANPVRSVPEPGKRGKVCHHVTAEQQLKWMTDRIGKLGLELIQDDNGPCVNLVSRKMEHFVRKEHKVTFSSATFEGIVKVVDKERLLEILKNGIGREKAYGCGLMTLSGKL